jgi:hypothetical protein
MAMQTFINLREGSGEGDRVLRRDRFCVRRAVHRRERDTHDHQRPDVVTFRDRDGYQWSFIHMDMAAIAAG